MRFVLAPLGGRTGPDTARACGGRSLASGPTAVLSHGSALTLWGFVKRRPDRFDVMVKVDRRPVGITIHRRRELSRRDVRCQLGIAVTSPAVTILDCAPALEPKAVTRTVNDALHTPFLTRAQLTDVRYRFSRHPGSRLLDPFIDTRDGATRSPWENDFPAFCERYGLPTPQMNARVCGFEVDAYSRPSG